MQTDSVHAHTARSIESPLSAMESPALSLSGSARSSVADVAKVAGPPKVPVQDSVNGDHAEPWRVFVEQHRQHIPVECALLKNAAAVFCGDGDARADSVRTMTEVQISV